MIRKYGLPVLAAVGFLFAVWLVVRQSIPVPAAPPVAPPSRAPFDSYVAGSGIIEASTENIAIGTNVAGVVTDVYVKPNSLVKVGDPLFKIDDRALKAELVVRETALQVARQELVRLEKLPRPEDIPPAEAQVREAESSLADLRNQLRFFEEVQDKRAISMEELERRQFAVRTAEARLEQAQAQLNLLKAGTWKPDLEIARVQIAAAEAQVAAVRTDLERLTVRSPIAGKALQVKVRVGEFAPTGVLATPLVLLGSVDRLHVRVDVDENDAWRIVPSAPAMAFVRGNCELNTPLTFVRVEPYVIPKKSLTGDSVERVDTRVLQIVYSFSPEALPVYAGQQVDIFIKAPPVGRVGMESPPTKPAQEEATGGHP